MKDIYTALILAAFVMASFYACTEQRAQVKAYESYIASNSCELVKPVRTNAQGQKAHMCKGKEVYIDPYKLPESR